MAVPVVTLPADSVEMQELAWLTLEVMVGNPRPFVERYCKIEPEREPGSQLPALVPMLFENEPNQVYYYQRLFDAAAWEKEHPGQKWEPWVVDAICLKDRKARWTAFWTACLFAKMRCIPGTHILCIVNAEDTFDPINKFLSGYWNNMPSYARPVLRGGAWAKESNTMVFETPDGGELTSSFTIRTVANANVGTGVTPTDVVLDEYGKFPATFSQSAQMSFRASMPVGCALWRGGTVGPEGSNCAMYAEIKDFKDGLLQTDYLFRTWFANPANILLPSSRERRPQDMKDENIAVGVDAGSNGDKEAMLVKQFPDDGLPWQWRLAWRRSRMRLAMRSAGEDPDVASTLFQREHCEDDQSPWLIPGHTQFKQPLLEQQTGIANAPENAPIINEPLQGLWWRTYRPYDPSHFYCIGGDLGSGSGGDDTAFHIQDGSSGTFIGELQGNVTDPYNAVTALVKFARYYGNALIVLETNRFPGIGDYVHDTLGYDNVWIPPQREGESYEAYHNRRRHYGINVSKTHHGDQEPSAESLNAMFKADFNAGAFRIVNPHLLRTMQQWDPNRDKHTPDRIAACRLVRLGLSEARGLRQVTGRAGGGRVTHTIVSIAGGDVMPFPTMYG